MARKGGEDGEERRRKERLKEEKEESDILRGNTSTTSANPEAIRRNILPSQSQLNGEGGGRRLLKRER